MKKVVRLTESDLIKIVKKVIQEDENGFTFGDKVRNKVGSFFGLEDETRTFKMIGEELYKKVKNGDYEIIKTVSNPETQKYPRIFEIRVKIFNTPWDVSIHHHDPMMYELLKPVIYFNHPGMRVEKPTFVIRSKGFIKTIAEMVAEKAPKTNKNSKSQGTARQMRAR